MMALPQGPKPGPFDEPDSHRTLALEVEGRKFWVSREVLSYYSPVFKTMLYGEFAKAKKETIKLPDKKAKDVRELLLCLLPTPEMKPVDYSNVELMLKFADEYQINELRRRARNALIRMARGWGKREPRLLEILRIGSTYRMKEVLQEIVKRCGMEFNLNELQSKFTDLRSEVIAGLMQYRIQTPVDSKCRYESFSGSAYCVSGQKFTDFFKCIYCGTVRCSTCLDSGVVRKAKCKPIETVGIDAIVRSLLDRM